MQEKRHDCVVEMRLCFFSVKVDDYKVSLVALTMCRSTVFHSNGLLQLNITPPKPEYYVNSLILKEIREIDYIVSKASKL